MILIPDKIFFINILRGSVSKLTPILKTHIFRKISDRSLKEKVEQWGIKQGIASAGDENYFETVAIQISYDLITKILFYFTIRKHFTTLPDCYKETKDPRRIEEIFRECFAKAQEIDWQAVFDMDIAKDLGFPDEMDGVISSLLEELKHYNFSTLKEDVIGEIFEELIPEEDRHLLGQYFTRENLVDLIIGFTVQNYDGSYCDPTCGSGTFCNRIYSRLRWLSGYKKQHNEILGQVWGIDIAHFPAELAAINLFRQEVHNFENFPRIIVSDVFDIYEGKEFDFPPLKSSKYKFKIKEKFPLMNGITGNFPYIRQELIEKKVKGYKKFITKTLAEDWFPDYMEIL